MFLALRLETNSNTFERILNGSPIREDIGVGRARVEEEGFLTNHTANLYQSFCSRESCSSQLTFAMWVFHELLEMEMMRSLPKMDLGTAMRCCAGGAPPAVEKIAAPSSGLKEGVGGRARKHLR